MEEDLDEFQKSLWLNQYWHQCPYLAFDTETTGVGKDDRICEIAIAVAKEGNILRRYQTFIDPQIHIREEITAIHGITNDMVSDAPLFEKVMDDILEFFSMDIPIVAHNLSFDSRFLLKEIPPDRWPQGVLTLCTLDFAKYRHASTKGLKSHKLEDLATYYYVKVDDLSMHGAMYDTEVLVKIVPKLMSGRYVGYNYTKLSEEWLYPAKKKKKGVL